MSFPGVIRAAARRTPYLVVLLASLAACRSPGVSATPQDVTVALSEWTFTSSSNTFRAGVPYRFQLRNAGTGEHEWAVVPAGAMDESQALIEVEEDWLPSGATISRTLTFPAPGRYDFVCFLPGHLEAGMRHTVEVVAR